MNDNKISTKGFFSRILLLILWFGLLILIVDGFGFFSVMADTLGLATETILWLLVLIPAIPVARYAWRLFHHH